MSGILVHDACDSPVEFANCARALARPAPLAAQHSLQHDRLSREARAIALLDLLEVQVDAFAMCEIEDRCGLIVPPTEKLIVHYVLEGEGTIVSERGSLPIKEGMVIVIPKLLAKQVNGREPIHNWFDVESSCQLSPGIIKLGASSGSGRGLILGCASVDASLGPRLSLFEYLTHPLTFSGQNQNATLTFRSILQELSNPGIGTKVVVDTLMKQILLLLLRDSLKKSTTVAAIATTLVDRQIIKAITNITARPQDPHTVDNLACLVGMSRSCFARSFSETVGMSPMRYVQAARLTLASTLLRSSTVPIKSIAISVGYASRSQFSRAFALMFGTDPTTFRNQTGSAAVAATDCDSAKPRSATPEPTPAA